MGHGHDHGSSLTGRRLLLSVLITIAFVVVEAATGYFSNSLALMSDAGHNFADALALILSWYGLWIAGRPSSEKHSYGYHRVGILTALINAVALVVIALLVFWEAISRLRHPEPVQSKPMIIVALIAIFLNTVISLWLRKAAEHDLNVRSPYMHMLGDDISRGHCRRRCFSFDRNRSPQFASDKTLDKLVPPSKVSTSHGRTFISQAGNVIRVISLPHLL